MTLRAMGWLGFTATLLATSAMGADSCLTESRIPIVLKTGPQASNIPARAYLHASLAPELRIVAGSGRLLWSAGATGRFTQQFPDLTAGFTSSVAVVDLDGDGAHDRIYAGDVLGRLWRFDLHGEGSSLRVTGGVFADFRDGDHREGVIGRGFVAAPDVTLIAPAVGAPWLSIAIGTANTTPAMVGPVTSPMTHRFFVLRDRGPLERWTQSQHDRWKPVVMADLLSADHLLADRLLADGKQIDPLATGAGFYLNLGTSQVIAPALTLDGKTIFTLAHTSQSQLFPCGTGLQVRAPVSVGSVSAIDGLPAMDLDGDGSRDAADLHVSLEGPLDALAAVSLVPNETDTEGGIHCTVAGQVLPDCSLDTRLYRSFWRREDAD